MFCETHPTPKFENNFQFYPSKDFKEHLGFLKKLLKNQQFKFFDQCFEFLKIHGYGSKLILLVFWESPIQGPYIQPLLVGSFLKKDRTA